MTAAKPLPDELMITACAECLRVSCFSGAFLCEDARDAATTEITVARLRRMKLEDSGYWEHDPAAQAWRASQ